MFLCVDRRRIPCFGLSARPEESIWSADKRRSTRIRQGARVPHLKFFQWLWRAIGMSDQSVKAERNRIGSHFSTAWRATFEIPRRRGTNQRRKSDYGQASTFMSRTRSPSGQVHAASRRISTFGQYPELWREPKSETRGMNALCIEWPKWQAWQSGAGAPSPLRLGPGKRTHR